MNVCSGLQPIKKDLKYMPVNIWSMVALLKPHALPVCLCTC
jgi:hypothetical protein